MRTYEPSRTLQLSRISCAIVALLFLSSFSQAKECLGYQCALADVINPSAANAPRLFSAEQPVPDDLQIEPSAPMLLRLASGEFLQLHVKSQEFGYSHEVSWSSSDPRVAQVSAFGLVLAADRPGSATLTATHLSGLEAKTEIVNLGKTLSVLFRQPSHWSETYAYAFTSGTRPQEPLGRWPGSALRVSHRYGGEWMRIVFPQFKPDPDRPLSFVFHSGNGQKSEDLPLGDLGGDWRVAFDITGRIPWPQHAETVSSGQQVQTSAARLSLSPIPGENLSGSLFQAFQIVEVHARDAAPGEMFSHYEGTGRSWLLDPTSQNTQLMVGSEQSYSLFAVFVPTQDLFSEERAQYAALCAGCHGLAGEGPSSLLGVQDKYTVSAMTQIIQDRMPMGSPSFCVGECATSLARFLKAQAFSEPRDDCSPEDPDGTAGRTPTQARNLRFLTRSEYLSAIEMILQPEANVLAQIARQLPDDFKVAGFRTDANTLADERRVRLFFQASILAAEGARPLGTLFPECRDRRCEVGELGLLLNRRPLTPEEKEHLLEQGEVGGDRLILLDLLNGVDFLYRSELGVKQEGAEGAIFELTGFELATWLAFTFTGAPPTRHLLRAAEEGELSTPEGLSRTAISLLNTPRAREHFRKFTEGWLNLDVTSAVNLTDSMKNHLREETLQFVEKMVFEESARVPDLLLAEHTWLNAELARHYGVENFQGEGWQRVEYTDALGDRKGLLGHAQFFAAGAGTEHSHPVKRGLFIRDRLLCQDFPPPPVGAELRPVQDPSATTREKFEIHHARADCASCHQFIDGIGFGLEGFGPTGLRRSHEQVPDGTFRLIDDRGEINSLNSPETVLSADEPGVPFSGIRELADILEETPHTRSCFVRQYFRFAYGRREKPADQCGLRMVGESLKSDEESIKDFMATFVTLPNFRLRQETSQ